MVDRAYGNYQLCIIRTCEYRARHHVRATAKTVFVSVLLIRALVVGKFARGFDRECFPHFNIASSCKRGTTETAAKGLLITAELRKQHVNAGVKQKQHSNHSQELRPPKLANVQRQFHERCGLRWVCNIQPQKAQKAQRKTFVPSVPLCGCKLTALQKHIASQNLRFLCR